VKQLNCFLIFDVLRHRFVGIFNTLLSQILVINNKQCMHSTDFYVEINIKDIGNNLFRSIVNQVKCSIYCCVCDWNTYFLKILVCLLSFCTFSILYYGNPMTESSFSRPRREVSFWDTKIMTELTNCSVGKYIFFQILKGVYIMN
jgi:hypothetical protein